MQWFVTGYSGGLGIEFARAALDAGQTVIASSRNPGKTPELVAEIQSLGGHWVALDTSSPDLEKIISEAAAKYGPIDVLVNNAAYVIGGPLETQPMDTSQQIMASNLFGSIRASQTVLPSMRARKQGTIINVRSAEFWEAHPGVSMYAASKFALEGMSEALRDEVAEFGIRVLLAEPGGMHTSFVDPRRINSGTLPELPQAYKGTMVDHVLTGLKGLHGNQTLDPKRVAAAVVKEVLKPTLDKDGKPMLRMPLGKESLSKMKSRAEEYKKDVEVFKDISLQCDFPE